jgi:site-specific recombinase XerD
VSNDIQQLAELLLRKYAVELGMSGRDVIRVGEQMAGIGLRLREAADHVGGYWRGTHHETYVRRLLDGMPAVPGRTEFVDGMGDRVVTEILEADLTAFVLAVRAYAAASTLANALEHHRQLRSWHEDAHGYLAAEKAVGACRLLFDRIQAAGLALRNPAEDLTAPERRPDEVRTFTSATQILDVLTTSMTRGQDPELDMRVLELGLTSCCRARGAMELLLGDLRHDEQLIQLFEKGHKSRLVPLSTPRLADLDAFARSRGASAPHDHVLRYPDGTPLTRRHLDTWSTHVKADHSWAAGHQFGLHWCRRAFIRAADDKFGYQRAGRIAGHSQRASSATAAYLDEGWLTARTLTQLREASTWLCGPLDTAQPFWAQPHPDFNHWFPAAGGLPIPDRSS